MLQIPPSFRPVRALLAGGLLAGLASLALAQTEFPQFEKSSCPADFTTSGGM
jgi:hypothetical protein